MIALLTGAKKNIGDFLIADRSRRLIQSLSGETEFLEIDRWRPIDCYLDGINDRCRAVVICGGPAFGRNFYPDILPLIGDLQRIKVPIVPLGVGAEGMQPSEVENFQFTKESVRALHCIHDSCRVSGVRDEITKEILGKAGIKNVTVTGCPVMFDFDKACNGTFVPPASITRIVITPPANRKNYHKFLEMARSLRILFPDAEIIASFHRGILPDPHTTVRSSVALLTLVAALRLRGIFSRDTAYDLSKLDFYRECDLHVGYRVHAHVMFTSMNKPTFLIQEDTRGIGLSTTLGTDKMDMFANEKIEKIISTVSRESRSRFSSFNGLNPTREKYLKEMKKVAWQFK